MAAGFTSLPRTIARGPRLHTPVYSDHGPSIDHRDMLQPRHCRLTGAHPAPKRSARCAHIERPPAHRSGPTAYVQSKFTLIISVAARCIRFCIRGPCLLPGRLGFSALAFSVLRGDCPREAPTAVHDIYLSRTCRCTDEQGSHRTCPVPSTNDLLHEQTEGLIQGSASAMLWLSEPYSTVAA